MGGIWGDWWVLRSWVDCERRGEEEEKVLGRFEWILESWEVSKGYFRELVGGGGRIGGVVWQCY